MNGEEIVFGYACKRTMIDDKIQIIIEPDDEADFDELIKLRDELYLKKKRIYFDLSKNFYAIEYEDIPRENEEESS